MRLQTILEAEPPKHVIAVLPGGYHPFHQGHLALYNAAVKKYGAENVFVAATNDTSERPFPFDIKSKLAYAAGVAKGHFIQVEKPFNADQYSNLTQDPAGTALVFVRSDKDKFEQPLPGKPDAVVTRGPRKGLPPYILGMGGEMKGMSEHAYLDYLPTVQFKAGRRNITSASELRAEWPHSDDATKNKIVADLYPAVNDRAHAIIKGLLNQALDAQAELAEEITDEAYYGAVEFNEQLNPKLWNGKQLDEEVAGKLDAIARFFIKFLDVPTLRVRDITISGSNAAYTYTEHSDIDLHIIVRPPRGMEELYRKFFDAKKNLFNDQHDIRIYGQPVELYVQFEDQPHISAGIYSLLTSKWLMKPKKERAEASHSDVKSKAKYYVNAIEDIIHNDDRAGADKLWDKIKNDRKEGLSQNGEFGTENLVFKLLRNIGFLDLLERYKQQGVNQELSLSETGTTL